MFLTLIKKTTIQDKVSIVEDFFLYAAAALALNKSVSFRVFSLVYLYGMGRWQLIYRLHNFSLAWKLKRIFETKSEDGTATFLYTARKLFK